MARVPVEHILDALAIALNAMPDVFSTPQWGGRAYKLPGPGSRGTKKPVLLTHISISEDRDAVRLAFRLEKPRAKAIAKQFAFIKPSTFGTLGKSGWLEMTLTTKAQCKVVIGLLQESRALHPVSEAAAAKAESKPARKRTRDADTSGEVDSGFTKQIDAVLRRKREEGWTPRDDGFDL